MKTKNQHYVPQFYLRNFSVANSKTHIGLFFLDKEHFQSCVPIKTQARESYFYGEDGVLEKELSGIEHTAAPILKNIITTAALPPKNSEDYKNLLHFCIIMTIRTKDAVEHAREHFRKMISEIKRRDNNFDLEIEQQIAIAKILIEVAHQTVPTALDLKMKLLQNNTDIKFIASDHPVVKYNQFLEQRDHPGGNRGLATKGLQMFFPISPDFMLCIYDENVYKIGTRKTDTIELGNPDDIDTLNLLQVINCYDHLYFNHESTEKYIRTVFQRGKDKRVDEYTNMQEIKNYIDEDGFTRVQYHSWGNDIKTELRLSFIKQTKKAKKHVLSDYTVQLRDESLRQKHPNR